MSMKWKDLVGKIGKAAPFVGSLLGGKAGGAVGEMLAGVLGVDNTPDAVSAALKNDPEALVKIKKFELENEQHIRNHAFNILDKELLDKQNARSAHAHSPMPGIICLALTAMVTGGAAMLFTIDIPSDNREIAYLLFGTLLAKWGDSIAYWVGTTRSSANKSMSMSKEG